MQVSVSGFYQDGSKGAEREISIGLDSGDGTRLFPDKWEEWTPMMQVRKLSAMADIFLHQYAASRNFRAEHAVAEDIEAIIRRDLT